MSNIDVTWMYRIVWKVQRGWARVCVAWRVLCGGPVLRLHHGASLINAEVFGGIWCEPGEITVSNCTIGPRASLRAK